MILNLYALCDTRPIEVHLPDVLAGHYRNADPYFAKALLAASIAYKKDILECATPEEVEWTKKTFDRLGTANSPCTKGLHEVVGLFFKFKDGPAGEVFPPPSQIEAYDKEQELDYAIDRHDPPYARMLYFPRYEGVDTLKEEGFIIPLEKHWSDLSRAYYESLRDLKRPSTHIFYSIGIGLAAGGAIAASKAFQTSTLRYCNIVTYHAGAQTGEFVLKEKEWEALKMTRTQSTLGETHILRYKEPKMDEPIPFYDRNPLWNIKFCGYRYPATSRDLIITGHHNGPNKHSHEIPDSYCPYFRTRLLHPWLIPWGFTPYGTHIHKGWFRPKLR